MLSLRPEAAHGFKNIKNKTCFQQSCPASYRSAVQGLAKRPATQTASVKAFFIHLYWTSAESMTTKLLGLWMGHHANFLVLNVGNVTH